AAAAQAATPRALACATACCWSLPLRLGCGWIVERVCLLSVSFNRKGREQRVLPPGRERVRVQQQRPRCCHSSSRAVSLHEDGDGCSVASLGCVCVWSSRDVV
ncbi:unnamed protein product, partial [Ectocarpus fasciculatus]